MLNIIGQMFGSSGYSNHTRYLSNELNKLIDCKVSTNLIPGYERDVNDQELQMIKRQEDYEINLIITHPLNWRVNCNAKRNFVYLIWEGDSVPKWIVDECLNENIEKIIVPSKHTKDALIKTLEKLDTSIDFNGSPIILPKVKIIPHGVDLNIFHPIIQPKYKADENKGASDEVPFKFLMNKGFRNMEDRGGVQYGIKAYLEEFTNKDNVELIVKINPAYGIPDIDKMFGHLDKPDNPKMTFIVDNMTPKQLNNLYNNCDVFVSPTRAEAFNIPCLEAMACGKPVITTNYGGQTDFVNEDNGWLIDYDLVEVEHELEYEGVKWATPKIESLKRAMRTATTDKKILEKKSKCALETAKKLTWENTAKQIHTLLNTKV